MNAVVAGRYQEISLWYDNTDISADVADEVESLTYTDCASEMCDSIDLKISSADLKWLYSWMPDEGTTLRPKITGRNWDAAGDRQVIDCGLFTLDERSFSDAPRTISIGGVARPSDKDFSSRERGDVWKNTSISRIGKTIAARYGLGFSYDGDDHDIEKREQNESDSSFLKTLCSDYGMTLKVYANRIWIYDREEYKSKAAVQTIADSDIKPGSFNWTTELANTYTGGTFSYTDQDKDADITASVGGGDRILSVNQYASSVADAAAQLVAAINNANHGKISVSFTIGGNFVVFAGNNINLTGFGPHINGKYFVDKVTRTIDRSGGFVCKIEASGITDPFYAWQVGGTIQYHEKTATETSGYDSTYSTTSPAANAASATAGGTGGQAITLKNCPLYYTSVAKTKSNTVSGTYYLYDGVLVAGRYRITNLASRCGKLPVGKNVTGWVNASDINKVTSSTSSTSSTTKQTSKAWGHTPE